MLTASEAFLAGALNANNPFVETVTYTPDGGTAKSVLAVVDRGSGSIKRGVIANRTRYKAEIMISADTTSGIAQVTPRKDIVVLAAPELANSTEHTFTVHTIIGKSTMGWHLGLQQ